MKQQKQQQNEKKNTTDVLDIMIKKYGKKTISSKYQNEDMWFGDHKKVNDVSWVGMINNLSNETTFDLYMRNEETRNWWSELQGEMDYNQIPSDRFETEDEKALLIAGSGVLQDLGFNLDESETQLGVLVGSKKRDATDAGQMAGAIAMAVLFGSDMAVDKDQLIRASLVTKQSKNGGYLLRITFQRVVWNNKGVISKIQAIKDNDIYVQFFDKLSKAVFLDAQEI